MPLVIFFAIGVSILLSNNKVSKPELVKKGGVVPYAVFSVSLVIVLITLSSVVFSNLIPGHYRLAGG